MASRSPSSPTSQIPFSKIIKASPNQPGADRLSVLSWLCEAGANVRGGKTSRHKVEGSKRRERTYSLRRIRPLCPAKTEPLRMGHTMRNLAEMGLLKNRSAFICRPTPEEALKWGDSLDKLLTHKCKLLLPPLLSLYSLCLWCLWCIAWNRGRD